MKRSGWPVSKDSTSAISSARASMASAIAWSNRRRRAPGSSHHSPNASTAASVALATSISPPRAISLIGELSTGVRFVKVSPEAASISAPPMKCPRVRSRKRARWPSSFARFSSSGWFIGCLPTRFRRRLRRPGPRSHAAGCKAARASPAAGARGSARSGAH